MSEQKPSLESWDGLLTNFLKADSFETQEEIFAVVDAKLITRDNGANNISLSVTKREGTEKYIFDLNITNQVYLKNNGITAPKEIIGKQITLKKVTVMNPTTKKEVEGLRVCAIEQDFPTLF